MLVLGVGLSIPACILAAWRRSIEVLILARILGGVSAGMAYPTTLALITALWSGPARTQSIALWSALGGAIAALGPLVAGLLLEQLRVGLGLPGHPAAGRRGPRSCLAARAGPRQRDHRAGRQPGRHPVGRAGRRRSILAINFAPVPDMTALVLVLAHRLSSRRCRLRPPPAAAPEPALRPRRGGAADLLGGGRARASSCSGR